MRSLFLLPLLLSFSVPAIAESKTYIINVSAEDYRNYILNGFDRNGSVSGNDPTVTVTAGDTINFSISAPGHPFYIKTVYVGGSGSQVSTGTITGTQGTTNSSLSWNTSGVSAGTYYYVCSPHASLGMGGSIVVT